jgi:hypothetical protein
MTAVASTSSSVRSSGTVWLFSKTFDIGVFGGSALISVLFLAIGSATGAIGGDAPNWAWVPGVLLVDVAHVWASGFRVYFNPRELWRRPVLYLLLPVLAYAGLVSMFALGEPVFWRCLAYLAIFHFVRQQAGWVALYRARRQERDGRTLDMAAIYAATLYPLLYWHTHGRGFDWFVPGDLVRIPAWIDLIARPIYVLTLGLYAARSVHRALTMGVYSPGKDLVVATTAMCWFIGIIALNSDYGFTVSNVFIHGIPYVALIYAYGRAQKSGTGPKKNWLSGIVPLLATIWALAYFEELGWDRTVWHERHWLFGASWHLGKVTRYFVPLLAVPQVTHYILDGFIWRRKTNPGLGALFPSSAAPVRQEGYVDASPIAKVVPS